VIEQFRARHGSSIAVSTTGLCSRALHESGPADHHFYMQGSMGFALAIGLGVARGTPKSVFVLDGDGALIMRMGTMATVGRAQPPNLIHIVMDNRVYSSTGGQPTAGCVDFAQVALACGYRRSASCDGAGQLDDALEWVTREPGPTLLHIRVTTDESDAPPNRPEVAPDELAERFRLHVSRTAAEATAEGPGPAP
jgi:phosphonopyruvate decarboxylase